MHIKPLPGQIDSNTQCFPWPPKIISLLSVGLAVMIVFIDSDVPLGEELLGVNGSWQQHRAGWWCPVTRPHTRVINWPPLLQSTSAPLTVTRTWTNYIVLQSFPAPNRAWVKTEDWGWGWQHFRFKWGLKKEINWDLGGKDGGTCVEFHFSCSDCGHKDKRLNSAVHLHWISCDLHNITPVLLPFYIILFSETKSLKTSN